MRNYSLFADKTPSVKSASRWFDSASIGNYQSLCSYARLLADDSFRSLPIPDYLDIVRNSGLSTSIITGVFTDFDAQRWAAAFETARLAKSLLSESASEDDYPEKLLAFLNRRYKIVNDENVRTNEGSLWKILKNETASPEGILRLAAEISMQASFFPLVVSFHDQNGNELETVLELKKGEKSYIISFTENFVMAGANSQTLLTKNKSAKFANIAPAKFARYHLPAEPSDYKNANLALRKNLNRLLPDKGLPFFGEAPVERLKIALARGQKEGVPPSLFAYWIYPFFALRNDKEFSSFAIENLKSIGQTEPPINADGQR